MEEVLESFLSLYYSSEVQGETCVVSDSREEKQVDQASRMWSKFIDGEKKNSHTNNLGRKAQNNHRQGEMNDSLMTLNVNCFTLRHNEAQFVKQLDNVCWAGFSSLAIMT